MRKIFLTTAGLVIFSLVLSWPALVLSGTLMFESSASISLPDGKSLSITNGSVAQSITVNDNSTLTIGLASNSNITFQSTAGYIMSTASQTSACSGTTSSITLTSGSTRTVTLTTSDTVGCASSPGGGGGGGGGGGLPPVAPTNTAISVSSDSAETDTINVTLTLAATNAATMLIANESDFSNAGSWETYATSKSWTLTSELGTKTVYVKFRSSSGGQSSAVNDTIELVAVAEPTSGDVSGSAGGSVSLSDGKASVSVPAGAVSGSGTVSITPTTSYTAPGGSNRVIGGKVYDLVMTIGEENITTFSELVTLTFTYSDSDVAGIDESTLSVQYWSEANQEWLNLGGTVDADNNTITVETAHFTQFAIIGQPAAVVTTGELVKLECADGAELNDPCKAVYYLGNDGKRYVFPNVKTYNTWYDDFSTVEIIAADDLAGYMIGGNATYRPGVKMVKIQTDPKVYAVGSNGTLRWVTTGAIAEELYGATWATMIEDIPDAFFINYTEGSDIEAAADYDKTAVQNVAIDINTDKGL